MLGEYEIDAGYIFLTLKSGRSTNRIAIKHSLVQDYLDIDFAKYKFFSKHVGVISYKSGYMEVAVKSIRHLLYFYFRDVFHMQPKKREEETGSRSIKFMADEKNKFQVEIAPATKEFRFMVRANMDYDGFTNMRSPNYHQLKQIFTLRIENVKIQRFSQAQSLLQKISNSRECSGGPKSPSLVHKLFPPRIILSYYFAFDI